MYQDNSLKNCCRQLGIRCVCEYSHVEPRFRLDLHRDEVGPVLSLTLRNDDAFTARVVDCDPRLPGFLLEVMEETVVREEQLGLWLPSKQPHLFLVRSLDHGEGGADWVVQRPPRGTLPRTAAEAAAD
jgi:hypothetical protein